jgi:hypothetical protein
MQKMKVNSLADLVIMAAKLGRTRPAIRAAAAGNRVEGPCYPGEIVPPIP